MLLLQEIVFMALDMLLKQREKEVQMILYDVWMEGLTITVCQFRCHGELWLAILELGEEYVSRWGAPG